MRCVLSLVLLGACSPASEEPGTSSGAPTEFDRPVNDLAGLVGNTYVFDFTDPGFRAIRNLGLDAVGWPFLLFEVTAADASGVDLRMGAVHEDAPTVQDPCWPTTELEGTIAGAVLSTAETSVALPIGSVEYLTLDGVFTPTGDALVGVRLQYAADARNQDILTPENVCSSVAIFGEGCVDCPDGSGPWCVFSEFELDEMTVDPTFSVVPATACD
jgi:hypothetical protein